MGDVWVALPQACPSSPVPEDVAVWLCHPHAESSGSPSHDKVANSFSQFGHSVRDWGSWLGYVVLPSLRTAECLHDTPSFLLELLFLSSLIRHSERNWGSRLGYVVLPSPAR